MLHHHQHDKQARDHEGDDRSRPRGLDDHPATDEKTRTDDTAQGDHHHVPLLQAMV